MILIKISSWLIAQNLLFIRNFLIHRKRKIGHKSKRLMPYFLNFLYFRPKIHETMATKITAPIIDGTIAIPAKLGPHVPKMA